MVLDISTYAFAHPGGAFLLEHNVGRDVSKYFYGAYGFDGNKNDPQNSNNCWVHSNIARKIANKHAIGAFVRNNTSKDIFCINHPKIVNINRNVKAIPFICIK